MLAPPDLILQRHRALAAELASRQIDALLVTSRPNVAYLTGFFGSAGCALVTADSIHLFSDARYAEPLRQAERELPHVTSVIALPGGLTTDELLAEHVGRLAPCGLGFDPSAMTVRQHSDLGRRIETAAPGTALTAVDGLIEDLRVVKDAWEVATLREAGRRLTDVAKCIIPKALAGVTESGLAGVIEGELRRKGFDGPAFDTIVASGPNAARPHHHAGERMLETGDLVVIDFGGMFRGYAVDMTRTVTIGRATARQQACWDAVARAERAAFAAAQVGIDAEAVDEVARQVLEAEGLAEWFTHSLGHGLGLEVHERPRLSRRRAGAAEGPLQANMVFTLEPGVYIPGWGGIRIEDDVLATGSGPEWLTEPVAAVRAT